MTTPADSSAAPFDFYTWEKKARGVDYKPAYTALAGGDVEAGVLLSQIVYWFMPSQKTGKSKLRVNRNGRWWIAKQRGDWEPETGLDATAFDRAAAILEARGLIFKGVFHFHNRPCVHVALNVPEFLGALEELVA